MMEGPKSGSKTEGRSGAQYYGKVGVFAGLLGIFTFVLVYITGPRSFEKPQIRVLYISYSDPSSVKRSLPGLGSSSLTYDDSVQTLKISKEDNSVVIDKEEWDLDGESQSQEPFFQNNIVLECTSSFPVEWKYWGYGSPSVLEENVRIHRDFNDTSTFSYLSILNLMPVTEKTTGTYTCSGMDNETRGFSASVHLFVPGSTSFLIDYDTTIESPEEDHIVVPCPVTNASANITLYFKDEIVPQDSNLFTFNPKSGFTLTPKFVEEQAEPWGQFYCRNEDSGEKSGVITIQPAKELIVNAIPETSTVLLSKDMNGEEDNEMFKFLCQAKEEITLKFIKMMRNPMVQYDFNSSSTFPFSAYTEVRTRHFRNSSRIYCRTLRSNEDLHSWKVLFSSLSLRSELMDFSYDASRDDFSCCSPSNKKARLSYLPCTSISECRIKGHCLLPGHLCHPDMITVLPERAGCVRFKLMQGELPNGNDVSRRGYGFNYGDGGRSGGGRSIPDNTPGPGEEGIQVESGLLQCYIEGKDQTKVYFAVRSSGENGSLLTTISDSTSDSPDSTGVVNASGTNMQIMELTERKTIDKGRRRFLCKGAKFFLAVGFLWQTVTTSNEIKYHIGRDVIKGPWIQSRLDIPLLQANSRGRGSSKIKRIYCIAPLWHSDGGWVNTKLDLD